MVGSAEPQPKMWTSNFSMIYIIISRYRKVLIIGEERMITSKQRAYLRSLAMTMDPIFQVGKSSLTPEIIEAIRTIKNCFDCQPKF